jgi:hypothetical protein
MVVTHRLRNRHLSNVVRRRSRTRGHHRPLFSLVPNLISKAHSTPPTAAPDLHLSFSSLEDRRRRPSQLRLEDRRRHPS